jgi:phosphoribosylcarboxyaminoimidazole (NCAIR) mutase
MIVLFAENTENVEQLNRVGQALGQFGLPAIRHVASATKTPGYVLQLAQQHDATFARLIYVTIGPQALESMLDASTTNPVIDGNADPLAVATAAAKMLGLEDTVLFGRTLLVQTNIRSAVLQADASLNMPQPQPPNTAFA